MSISDNFAYCYQRGYINPRARESHFRLMEILILAVSLLAVVLNIFPATGRYFRKGPYEVVTAFGVSPVHRTARDRRPSREIRSPDKRVVLSVCVSLITVSPTLLRECVGIWKYPVMCRCYLIFSPLNHYKLSGYART